MMRKISDATASFSASTPYRAEATISTEDVIAQNSIVDEPICYMRTEEGKTINLTENCGSDEPNSKTQVNTGSTEATTTEANFVSIKSLLPNHKCKACISG